MMENLRLDPEHLTFTVYEARPLRMTHAEVRACVWAACTWPGASQCQQVLNETEMGIALCPWDILQPYRTTNTVLRS